MWVSGREALMLVMRAWVRGSRAVLEEGVRMPRRMLRVVIVGVVWSAES